MKLSPTTKKWITVAGMTLLAASAITQPINLQGMLPAWLMQPKLGTFSLINVAAYVVLVGAYWVATKQTD